MSTWEMLFCLTTWTGGIGWVVQRWWGDPQRYLQRETWAFLGWVLGAFWVVGSLGVLLLWLLL